MRVPSLSSVPRAGGPESSAATQRRLPLYVALGAILLLWVAYTLLPGSNPPAEVSGALAALLGTLPGVLAVGLLLAVGLKPADYYLHPAPLSTRGLAALVAVTLLVLLVILVGSWTGPDWPVLLIYAPLSGITQELFFRSGLLTALLRTLGDRTLLALAVQAVLFTMWHLRTFAVAPDPAAIIPMVFVFLSAGMLWGWQVQHDRTVFWAMGHHALLLMAMSLFGLVSA